MKARGGALCLDAKGRSVRAFLLLEVQRLTERAKYAFNINIFKYLRSVRRSLSTNL